MSLTKAVHTRFWNSMAERFGKRWLDEYGDKPTKAWCDLIDRFTQEDITEALARLKDRPEHSRSHPPTHAEFEVLLAKAARANEKPSQDFMRAYWRTSVIRSCEFHAKRLGICEPDRFEAFLIRNRETVGYWMRDLLDEVHGMEKSVGQRTDGMNEFVERRCREILEAFQRAEAA